MKSLVAVFAICLSSLLFLSACATTGNSAPNYGNSTPASSPNMSASGSPSPLNTTANPWNQVNPQNQAQYQATRGK